MKSCLLIFIFASTALGLESEKFSTEAWREIASIYRAIVDHPFNQELKTGKLDKKVFAHYETQDAIYLKDFSRALEILAKKTPVKEDAEKLIQFARDSLEEPSTKAFPPLSGKAGGSAAIEASPATLSYSSFLIATAHEEGGAELSAALLPCFWIYWILAQDLKPEVSQENPYRKWIETYSSEKYREDAEWMIDFVDRQAAKAPRETRARMKNLFTLASRMEWYFWDSAYRLERWKP